MILCARSGFLYVVFASLVVLLALLGRQFLAKMRRRHGVPGSSASKAKAAAARAAQEEETGSGKHADIDFEWIPREVLNVNKSPGRSPGGSARHRRAKATRSDD